MTLNFDATGHWRVGALAHFNSKMEYQKRCDNTVADVLSWVITQLDPDTVKLILDGVAIGAVCRVETHGPAMVEIDHCLEQEVCVTAGHMLIQIHVMDWAEAQGEDPVLSAVLDWLKTQKRTDLKALLMK